MARHGYTEEHIGFALRQAESGTAVAEICRNMGVS
jgi:putative transposase